MPPRIVAIASLLRAASHGAVTELFLRRGELMPGGVAGAFTVVFCALACIWYHHDATRRGLTRRSFLGAVVFLLPVVGLPVYVASRSSQDGGAQSALKRRARP
jgi:hypothetical protein